ncbi:50S ribosomal protein L21 [Candidatus Uhrbacteria bacterium CG10_big_fil_rev_8_21_14_0_10_50_16]|uniref:Large ribosomal subunit protein bL21 n=1 Tax=Candidatus Uhrbacteria bacterium CG10_big_fil_rev_8_21_14_0_10_50_16 TaxID=1975039 RepID=A0A2H0RMQ6_9BACT|nr:MAG: 50S ribosomal protein L21 [Candidatus Uhrbacteria bacterium CG10_big_fil_rev_8_21_14_0_10_50_16]
MFAIIKTGGKQQVVEEGKWILTEKIEQEDGSKIEFEPLLVSNDRETKVGTPTVAGMKVTGTIMEQGRSEKVSIVKYKPKSNYRRRTGHRQPFTKVMIDTIA